MNSKIYYVDEVEYEINADTLEGISFDVKTKKPIQGLEDKDD
ncbi:hypothetical protein PL321_12650 [Caloramator sp. mosi_1]|nr:hypothetical protein [Caloramator sp. mosi_1]WDC83540.1 hypothetical protein PL321_12650 [Caloramator sp. mosi_1]